MPSEYLNIINNIFCMLKLNMSSSLNNGSSNNILNFVDFYMLINHLLKKNFKLVRLGVYMVKLCQRKCEF